MGRSVAMTQTTEKPPMLSLPAALQAGFELTSKKLWLLLFPLLFDCFLWLGPRLSLQPLVARFVQFLQDNPQPAGTANTQTVEFFGQIGETHNLFSWLSPPILGTPYLFKGIPLQNAPISPFIIDLNSILLMLMLVTIFSMAGLLYSTLFFDIVILTVQSPAEIVNLFWRRLPLNYLQMLGLAMAVLVVLGSIFVPLLVVGGLIVQIAPIVGTIIAAAIIFTVVSIMIYLLFAVHGMFFARQPIWRAFYDSFRIVRTNPHTAIWLIILLVGSHFLIERIWLALEDGTWFTLVSIFAHAFVQTSLLVASVLIYADQAPRLPVTDRPILT